jgi:prepilin-type processing-associated H-X9-DG protein
MYLKSENVKWCPNKPAASQNVLALSGFTSYYSSDYYSTNPAAAAKEFGPSMLNPVLGPAGFSFTGAATTAVQFPSQTLFGWEHLSYAPICEFIQPYNWYNSPPNDPTLIAHFHFLHTNATNAMWCDGHVKRLTYFALRRPMFSIDWSIYPNGGQ